MQLSPGGIHYITNIESFRGVVYLDQGGKPTIGFGHLIQAGEDFSKGITYTQGLALFRRDIRRYEQAVNVYVKVPLTQNQYDALVSLCYNIGVNAFAGSTLVKLLNMKKYDAAADQILLWDHLSRRAISAGLNRRRHEERAIFKLIPGDLPPTYTLH